MAKTKGELVEEALSQIGIASYEFDTSAEELESGMQRLDAMLAMWSDKGIHISYNFSGGVDDDSGLPGIALEAVVHNLAIRLAPSYGKQIPPEVFTIARAGMTALYSESARPRESQPFGLPRGAGYKVIDTNTFFFPEDKYSWVDTAFEDYSGGGGDIHIGDVGVVLQVTVSTDLAGASAVEIRYRKPSGEQGTWVGTVVGGDSIQYTTVAGDIDESGVWFIQAAFTLPDWEGSSKVVALRVNDSLEG